MEKTHVTTSGHDPQKMTEETDTEVKEDSLETTTTMASTAKSPQDTKTTTIKVATAEAQDIKAMKERTTKVPNKRIQRVQPVPGGNA
jgi:hypothetical protein